ncbi:MAG: AraC family transcriptional regulator [Chitinivibrionales bacterium]|nr:AraC family transcriptional regulator [Chitinivibrionales bacterium]
MYFAVSATYRTIGLVQSRACPRRRPANGRKVTPMSTLVPTRSLDTGADHAFEVWTGGFVRFNRHPTNCLHLHESHHELCLVLDGHGQYAHGDTTCRLRPGTLFFSELDVPHEISSYRSRNLHLVFANIAMSGGVPDSSEMLSRLLSAFHMEHRLVAYDQAHLSDYLPLLCRNGAGAVDELRRQSALRLFALEGLSALTVGTTSGERTGRDPGPVQRALDYLERHVREPFAMADVAKQACCSGRHLRRVFRRETGRGLLQTINERRMHLAAQHLLMRFTVTQVADAFGMSSVAHFSRLFKRVHGVSPKQYQQRHAPGPVVPRTSFRPSHRPRP